MSRLAIFIALFLSAVPLMPCIGAAAEGVKSDPEGPAVRPPYSMHAHQAQWPGVCVSAGKRQSPIALDDKLFTGNKVQPLKLNLHSTDAALIDTGHTYQVRFKKPAGTLIFEGRTYDLKQIHFHKPSEHTLNGKAYDMEIHLVFIRVDTDKSDNHLAFALGLPVVRGPENLELKKVWKFLPPIKEGFGEDRTQLKNWEAAMHTNELELSKIGKNEKELKGKFSFDARRLLPIKSSLFVYEGSLTTPGCDETVTHAVSKTPISMSELQMEHFEGYYEGSNRDLQPAGDSDRRNFRLGELVF